MSVNSYEEYRVNKIKSGGLYQDFVVDCCWNILGLVVVQYVSREYQYMVGESKTGIEIKHDEMYAKTGNLWIEVGEKARPREGPYAPSGIYRDDNTWLYVIGNYNTIFIFSKKLLRQLHECGKFSCIIENNTKTSRGYLLPHDDAINYSAQILYPDAEIKLGKAVRDIHEAGRILHDICKRGDESQLDLFNKNQA